MKKIMLALGLFLFSSTVQANVTLINKDSSSHDISIKCSSSTTSTSISGGTTRSIGNGPCTVTVKDSGATATGNDGQTLTITGGSVSSN